jgi:hypothetical protein
MLKNEKYCLIDRSKVKLQILIGKNKLINTYNNLKCN